MFKKAIIIIVFVCLFQSLFSQNFRGVAVELAPPIQTELNQQFTNYSVFQIDIDRIRTYLAQRNDSELSLSLENLDTLDLSLSTTDILSPNLSSYKKYYTFKGGVANGAEVRLTINKDFLYGYFNLNDDLLFVEPLRLVSNQEVPNDYYIFYKAKDVIEEEARTCGYIESGERTDNIRNHINQEKMQDCYEVRLAIASDKAMFDRYGSVNDVEDRNVGIINNVQGDYLNQFNDDFDFVIVEQVVITDNSDPFGTQTETDALVLIGNFTTWASLGGFSNEYDLAELWTAIDLTYQTSSGIVGLAYRPGICTSISKYHILEDIQASAGLMRTLVSHETGHNFSATHDDVSGINIMNSLLSDTQVWSSQSKSQVNAHISSSGCQTGSNALETCNGNPGGGNNTLPTVSFITPTNGQTFTEGQDLNVQAAASDSDGNVTSVELFYNNISRGTDNTAPYQWVVSFLTVGTHTLRVVATDNNGATAQSIITITVNPANNNTPPTVSFVTPNNGQTFTEGGNLDVQATASDSDGTVTQVQLFYDGNSRGIDNAPPYQWMIQNLVIGTHTLRVVATDNDGATAESTISITVDPVNNTPPTVSFVTPNNGQTFTEGGNLDVQATASDSDGNVTGVQLLYDGNSQGTDNTAPYQWTIQNLTVGTHTLQVIATDNDDATSESTISITVNATNDNMPPDVTFTNPTNGQTFTEGDNVLVEISASDNDGNVVQVELFYDGISEGVDMNPPYRVFLRDLTAGTHTLQAVATDNDGATAQETISIIVNPEGGDNCPAILTVTDNSASGLYVATQTVQTSIQNDVNITTSATFKAGTTVILKAGFWARANSTFSAIVGDVQSECGNNSQNNIESRTVFRSQNRLSIFPNPAIDLAQITLSLGKETAVQLELYDMNGRLIKKLLETNELLNGTHQIELNTVEMEAGLFYILLKTRTGIQSQKLIIAK